MSVPVPMYTEPGPFVKALERYRRACTDYGRVAQQRNQGDASYEIYHLAWQQMMDAERAVIEARARRAH